MPILTTQPGPAGKKPIRGRSKYVLNSLSFKFVLQCCWPPGHSKPLLGLVSHE
jgi:hypothetical protein